MVKFAAGGNMNCGKAKVQSGSEFLVESGNGSSDKIVNLDRVLNNTKGNGCRLQEFCELIQNPFVNE